MKRAILITCLSLSLSASFGQTFNNALDYLNYFNGVHMLINNYNMDYLQHAVHSEDFNLIETKRQNLIEQINAALEKTQSLTPYNGEETMKNGLIEILEDYKLLFEVNFKEVNVLKYNSKESYEAMEAYFDAIEAAENKTQEAASNFRSIQEAYAKANNIQLIDTGADNQIIELNDLNNYYRSIFKQFFRLNKLNTTFVEAMNGQNIEGLKAILEQLKMAVKEVNEALEPVEPFKGEDATYCDKAKAYTKLTDQLTKDYYPALINALQKQINGAVLSADEVEAYNTTIEKINTELLQLTNEVPQAGNELLKKYVPKPVQTKKI